MPRPRASARRCIVKARFVAMNAYGKRAASLHLSYIERDGVEADGSPGRLYGAAHAAELRESLSSPLESEKRQFRFIVSPEDGVEIDLTAFTRHLMAQMETDLGRKLVWGAVNHWNTDNPHIHVVVRRLIARVARLEHMGLAMRVSPVEWRFDARWVETLRSLGQAKDIIKRMYSAIPAPDPSQFIILDQSVSLEPVDGVVRSKGLHDELSGQPFTVIEAVDGRVFYARIDLPTAERIRENDVVRLASRQQDPRGDVAQAKARPHRILVQRLGPPIALQQRYRGPTWLDTIDTTKLPKPARGFAAELAGSLTQRSANVRAMGISSADPVARAAGLASLEVRAVGERLAADRGFTLVEPSRGITGLLTLSAKLPSGRQYAVVTDESSKQICVVLAHKGSRLLDGQTVRIWRNQDGRIAFSMVPPGRLRGPQRWSVGQTRTKMGEAHRGIRHRTDM